VNKLRCPHCGESFSSQLDFLELWNSVLSGGVSQKEQHYKKYYKKVYDCEQHYKDMGYTDAEIKDCARNMAETYSICYQHSVCDVCFAPIVFTAIPDSHVDKGVKVNIAIPHNVKRQQVKEVDTRYGEGVPF